jgi:arginyl-tRNA synthetase
LKQHLTELVAQSLAKLRTDGVLAPDAEAVIVIERARGKEHGDFACNIALGLARVTQTKPRELAEKIVAALPVSKQVAKVEIAGPGFINFFLSPAAYHAVVRSVLTQKVRYGRSEASGMRIHMEFVSANPNGPLHVGHGRGAAYGDSLARLLGAVGHQVHREYYINDAGRQMDILAVSTWLRYLELCGEKFEFPTNGYKGDYVYDIAATLHREHGNVFARPYTAVIKDVPPDEPQGGDKEKHIDALISRMRTLLGETDYRRVHRLGLDTMLANIRKDLEEFGVHYDEWYPESRLIETRAVERALALLKERGFLYEKDGAQWFAATRFGDEKDRVVVRENGAITYFASDIAYHLAKFEYGYTHCIDVWGSDHHGYVARVKAALTAMDRNPDALTVLLVQFAVLFRGGQKQQMSTRSGEFVTLRELRGEVGNDAARFFYVLRKSEAHMDFDLDLAKSQSNDNPVYYIQYAHARIHSVFRQLHERGLTRETDPARVELSRLIESHETELMARLAQYPETLELAARDYAPHQLAYYLRELANDLHTYYNAHAFLLKDDTVLRDARLALIDAARQVLANGLQLLGVSAPESM